MLRSSPTISPWIYEISSLIPSQPVVSNGDVFPAIYLEVYLQSLPDSNSHLVRTRSKTRNFNPKLFLTSSLLTAIKSYKDALCVPEWHAIMNIEYFTLNKNQTWMLVDLPS